MTRVRNFLVSQGLSEGEAMDVERWSRVAGIVGIEINDCGLDVYRIPSQDKRGIYFVCLETYFLCSEWNITPKEFFEFYARHGLGLPHPN